MGWAFYAICINQKGLKAMPDFKNGLIVCVTITAIALTVLVTNYCNHIPIDRLHRHSEVQLLGSSKGREVNSSNIFEEFLQHTIDSVCNETDMYPHECILELYNHPLKPFGRPDEKPRSIDPGLLVMILAFLRETRVDSNPSPLDEEIGTLSVHLPQGRVHAIKWYWRGMGARIGVGFGEQRFVTTGPKIGDDEALAFDKMLRAIRGKALE